MSVDAVLPLRPVAGGRADQREAGLDSGGGGWIVEEAVEGGEGFVRAGVELIAEVAGDLAPGFVEPGGEQEVGPLPVVNGGAVDPGLGGGITGGGAFRNEAGDGFLDLGEREPRRAGGSQ